MSIKTNYSSPEESKFHCSDFWQSHLNSLQRRLHRVHLRSQKKQLLRAYPLKRSSCTADQQFLVLRKSWVQNRRKDTFHISKWQKHWKGDLYEQSRWINWFLKRLTVCKASNWRQGTAWKWKLNRSYQPIGRELAKLKRPACSSSLTSLDDLIEGEWWGSQDWTIELKQQLIPQWLINLK